MGDPPQETLGRYYVMHVHFYVHSVEMVSVPQIVRSNNKSTTGSRKKSNFLNIRYLTPKVVIVNEMITDNNTT